MVNHLHSNVGLKFFSRGTIKISRPKKKRKEKKESIEGFLFLQFRRIEGFFSVVTSFTPPSHLFSGSKEKHQFFKTYYELKITVTKYGKDYDIINSGHQRGEYSPLLYRTVDYRRKSNVNHQQPNYIILGRNVFSSKSYFCCKQRQRQRNSIRNKCPAALGYVIFQGWHICLFEDQPNGHKGQFSQIAIINGEQ